MDRFAPVDAGPTRGAVSGTSSDRGLPRDIVVRRPVEGDIPALASHFAEMQVHYGRPVADAVAVRAAALACRQVTGLFDPRVLIATIGDTVVGSVVMNVTFPAAELTLALYIRDLYVAKTARRSGVGRRLVKAANELRARDGFSALEWTTDSSNAAARRLYEACGARQMDRTYFNERRGTARPVAVERRLARE